MKKIISAICALAMTVSMFGAFAMNANAAAADVHPTMKLEVKQGATTDNKALKVDLVLEDLDNDAYVQGAAFFIKVDAQFPFTFAVSARGTKNPDDVAGATDGASFSGTTSNDTAVSQGYGAIMYSNTAGIKPTNGRLVLGTFTLPVKEGVEAGATYKVELDADQSTVDTIYDDNTIGHYEKTGVTFEGIANGTITSGPKAAVVDSVAVAGPASVNLGKTAQFTATVEGTDGVDADGAAIDHTPVTWSVTGGKAGTSISDAGLLTVAADETATSLTVTATSKVDGTKTGTATIEVKEAADAVSMTMTDVTVANHTMKKITVTKNADADPSVIADFEAKLNGQVLVLVTGKTADDVVVGSAYVAADGATILADYATGADVGTIGLTGATKYEVSLLDANGGVIVTQ